MKFLAILFLLLLSLLWYFIWYNYLSDLIPNTALYAYNNYSILIFLAGMFVFWILVWKLIASEKKEIKKNNTSIFENDNTFIPEIKEIEKVTYSNYENDSDITKNSIDIILDEREENYKHKINLQNEYSKNKIDNKKENFIIKNNEMKNEFKIEANNIIEKKENRIEDTMFKNVANNIKKQQKQDLKIIEWIWPKIEELLNKWWIYSYKDLAISEITEIKHILKKAWKRYLMLHNPITWSKQASIANDWNFEKLEEYQKKLVKWVEVK